MKKMYILGVAAMVTFAVNAQTTLTIKNPLKKGNHVSEKSIGGGSTINQVAASITSNTQYVAGSTMDLNFTYISTNTDAEYGDLLTITFPAGITPTGLVNTSNPFPNIEDAGGGLEALNAPVGQVISWGVDNNDQYGGIFSSAGIVFTVNVTIGVGVTGNLNATFDLSGDGYGAAPGNLIGGSFTIYPAGASVVDLKTSFIQPYNLSALNVCNYGLDTLFAQVKNLGTTAESNISVTYSVNGVAQPAMVFPGPLAAGDSTYIAWLPAYDFSASNAYELKAWIAQAGDIAINNDTATLVFSNSVSTALTSTTYINGIESVYDYASLNRAYVSGDGYIFGPSQVTFNGGAQALFYTVPNAATAGVHEAMVILPCMDVISGETYRISFYKRINGSATTANGQSGVFTGLLNDATAMTTVLKAYTAIAPYAIWIKDSVDYTATATETRYFALGGTGAVVAGSNQINVRYDDVNITRLLPVGISETANLNEVSVYPNPSTGIFTVRAIENNSNVEVFNIVGNRVLSNKLVKGNNQIDMSNLSVGTYFFKVTSNGEVITKKVVLTK